MNQEPSKLPSSVDELAVMIKNSFDTFQKYLDNRFGEVKQDMHIMRQDVSELKQDVKVLKQDVGKLQRDVHSLDRRTEALVTDVGHIKKVLKRLPTRKEFTNLKKRVYALEHAP